ncbi:MAG: DUF58 domain-containing protein [Acidimicrobiales bacterium]
MRRSTIQVRPTAAGLAILAGLALIACLYVVGDRPMAIGYVVPIAVVAAADFGLASRALRTRPVSVSPVRTVAGSPEYITVRAEAAAGLAPLSIRVRPLSTSDESAGPVVLPLDGSSALLELPDGHPTASSHIRYRVSTSALGLVWARQWVAVAVPMLYRAPNPRTIDWPVHPALDEVARLREYVPGDRMGQISWPTTARTGTLHVRTAGVGDGELQVVLELGPTPATLATLTTTLSLASNVLGVLLEQGTSVRLHTRAPVEAHWTEAAGLALLDPKGPSSVVGVGHYVGFGELRTQIDSTLVADREQLLQRLAVAEPGAPVPRPPGPYLEIDPGGARFCQ